MPKGITETNRFLLFWGGFPDDRQSHFNARDVNRVTCSKFAASVTMALDIP
jgi:hypothetical protein